MHSCAAPAGDTHKQQVQPLAGKPGAATETETEAEAEVETEAEAKAETETENHQKDKVRGD